MAGLIGETNFNLPGQTDFVRGKVADNYTVNTGSGQLYVSVRTDRISAHDVVLNQLIPYKGQVLNQISTRLLAATVDVANNWLIDQPDPNVSIGIKAEPVKVEMIVRRYLLGSAWKNYNEKGMRNLCGHSLPNYMSEFEPFENGPLVTPTTKAEKGDQDITPQEIVRLGLATQAEYDQMEAMALDLFAHGQRVAAENELDLGDTKYEFGRTDEGDIIVIDEVHTPDSSRYYYRSEFQAYQNDESKERPRELSKEFVREWLAAQGWTKKEALEGVPPPDLPEEMVEKVSGRYIELYDEMIDVPFDPQDYEEDVLERIRANIEDSLNNLAA
jgi:phosphoribosylaminoimidazole-succinocarboxamide synthase